MEARIFRLKRASRIFVQVVGSVGGLFFAYTIFEYYATDVLFSVLCVTALLFCVYMVFAATYHRVVLTSTFISKEELRAIKIKYQDITSLEVYHDSAKVVGANSSFWIKKNIQDRRKLIEEVYDRTKDHTKVTGNEDEIRHLKNQQEDKITN